LLSSHSVKFTKSYKEVFIMSENLSVRKFPELKVVFDSNALYSGSASDLLNIDAAQLIIEHSNHSDIIITWLLPNIVVHERQFQMLNKGLELLPSIQKLEKLLGHNLNITKDIIKNRVKEAVDEQIAKYKIQVFFLDTTKVDWERLTLDAVYRQPPFEIGEKEKGFRDALIAETFMQIVDSSAKTPKKCRVALVTGDKLLSETIEGRIAERKNIRILSSNEELIGLINTLVSEVSEEFVARIQEQANKYFFIKADESTLYYKEEIKKQIQEKFSDELHALPPGGDRRENVTWRISKPRFLKKEGQRVYWITRITVDVKVYKYTTANIFPVGTIYPSSDPFINRVDQYLDDNDPNSSGQNQIFTNIGQPSTAISQNYIHAGQGLTGSSSLYPQGTILPTSSQDFEVFYSPGDSIFEVTWSVTVRTNRKFSAPTINEIKHIVTAWG
jgi:hypothetical protein